jgi:hypothetical protein
MARIGCFEIRKLDKKQTNLEVTIIITKEFKFRIWIAKKLFKLGAAILGASLFINEDTNSD